MTVTQNRQPRGIPTGGRFAASAKTEADAVSLDDVHEYEAVGLPIKTVTLTPHFLTQAVAKGFEASQIIDAIENPYKVTPVTRYPGQKRYCGRGGIAVVMDGNTAITAYLDGVVTEMRADQRHDPAARASRRLASA